MSDATLVPRKFLNVTPSDTSPIGSTLGLRIGVGGNVTVKGSDGVSALFICNAGDYLTGSFPYVMATGTTATNIVALKGD